jgi:RNase H-fold protein (predicted Holliday junction resolvase)
MQNTVKTILAISPGTRELGVAVVANNKLLFYAVKNITNRKTKRAILQKVTKILNQLILDYEISVLAIKQIESFYPNGDFLLATVDHIKKLAKQLKLTLYQYSSKEVYRIVCNDNKVTSQDIAKYLTAQYFELAKHINQTKRYSWKTNYYSRLFFAIALGLVCSRKLQKKS